MTQLPEEEEEVEVETPEVTEVRAEAAGDREEAGTGRRKIFQSRPRKLDFSGTVSVELLTGICLFFLYIYYLSGLTVTMSCIWLDGNVVVNWVGW